MTNFASKLSEELGRLGVECLPPYETRPGDKIGTPLPSQQITWGAEVFQEAAIRLAAIGPRLIFVQLLLPNSCIYAASLRFKNVYVRHLIDFVPGTDDRQERFDSCVMRAP